VGRATRPSEAREPSAPAHRSSAPAQRLSPLSAETTNIAIFFLHIAPGVGEIQLCGELVTSRVDCIARIGGGGFELAFQVIELRPEPAPPAFADSCAERAAICDRDSGALPLRDVDIDGARRGQADRQLHGARFAERRRAAATHANR